VKISRDQVIAYRIDAQQLHRTGRQASGLAVLDIGVQDAAGDQARLAFDARLPRTPPRDLFGPDSTLALAWTLRGAPYVHRRQDLDALAAALYPLSEADAAGRLNETGPRVKRAGISALDQYATAVTAMRDVVRKPMSKGAASTAVTKAIPAAMRRECRACKTSHISDSAMRAGFLAAGLELQPDTSPPVLRRRKGARVVSRADLTALRALVRAYLRLLGPATPVHVAGYLEARRADVEQAWPDDLVEVNVDGARAWLPAECEQALAAPRDAELVRLLGGFDPYLQARDRDVIVPDKAVHKALWPVLGRPGAVFVDGEVAGTWRPKASGGKLTVVIDEFAPMPPTVRTQIEAEAERVAAVRGLTLAAVT
jgi:Winged helix DNA-binding domain